MSAPALIRYNGLLLALLATLGLLYALAAVVAAVLQNLALGGLILVLLALDLLAYWFVKKVPSMSADCWIWQRVPGFRR